ncbi:hypothetical protein [Helicobacter pylori]|uniref:hypothetical protein n=1 Tax=Helicobacter pylori TaxID=210 RepID=UPI000C31372B|nr:hypothetical protein [Helicobacter pylori]
MLGLVVSGLLGLAYANDNDSIDEKQKQIDAMNIDPSNPLIIKEISKVLIRIDDHVKHKIKTCKF